MRISRSTYDIMMRHYMGFIAVDFVFLIANALGVGAADFSVFAFRRQSNYMYAPGGRIEMNLFYVLAGLLLPLAVGATVRRLLRPLSRRLAAKA